VAHPDGIKWTNKSVVSFAGADDPVVLIEKKARDLVLRARDAGWNGPPFNPIGIADLLKIPVEANAEVPDARTMPTKDGLKIQFNPTQARERVRFSIAHEIAHTLFPDVANEVRHRGESNLVSDDWQLEMLCNLAAAEFVMPVGSLPARDQLPSIEELMAERRKFDVSAEAFLIRVTKITDEPVIMFCASPVSDETGLKFYRVDYTVSTKSAPVFRISGRKVPTASVVHSCTAIGYTDQRQEKWFSDNDLIVECVGIPGYPGSRYPRVAGLIRFDESAARRETIKYVHGDVLDPRGSGTRVICQLVNDQARTWGGGVAKSAAKKFPDAQKEFAAWLMSIPRPRRLGEVLFSDANDSVVIASLVGQEGYGPSPSARIRYAALERCFERVVEFASQRDAQVHMPRIGAGQSGGSWDTVEEIVRDTLVAGGIQVTIYDLPPKRMPGIAGLFD
jgi:O-acetyl-ADP-ribose deacetylase (regulator of RNase III)